jgi:hypothetical protein
MFFLYVFVHTVLQNFNIYRTVRHLFACFLSPSVPTLCVYVRWLNCARHSHGTHTTQRRTSTTTTSTCSS